MLAKIVLVIYLVLINFIGIAFMAVDKIRAMEHRFRVPEGVLLTISIIGGSIGTILGMFLFHHKTRRQKFRIGLPAILAAQAALVILMHYLFVTIEFL